MKAGNMPLRWNRGHNPFVESLFQSLRVGPQARPPQIVAQANNLRLQLSAGRELRIGQGSLTEQDVTECSKLLREDAVRAEELLLSHWPVTAESANGPPDDATPKTVETLSLESLSEQIPLPAAAPNARPTWFTLAAPTAEIVPLPGWYQLGISIPDLLDHDVISRED